MSQRASVTSSTRADGPSPSQGASYGQPAIVTPLNTRSAIVKHARWALLGGALMLGTHLAGAFAPDGQGGSVHAIRSPALACYQPVVSWKGCSCFARPQLARPDDPVKDTPPVPELTVERTRLLTLAHPPFEGQRVPSALVYVPAGIDRSRPLDVVVFFHGWHGCASSVAASVPTVCHPGGVVRNPLGLIEQVRASGVGAVLVVPQMALEARSSDPGHFAEGGYLQSFLAEVLAQMEPELGAHRVEDLDHLVLASHSGGFTALLDSLAHGGARVDEVAFFDSLYDGVTVLDHWIRQDPERFQPASARPARIISAWRGETTERTAHELGLLAEADFAARHHHGWVTRRDTENPLTAIEARLPVVLVHVPGNHPQAARLNVAAMLQGSGIPPILKPDPQS